MKQEIDCAAKFLSSFVRRGTDALHVDLFCDKLTEMLTKSYEHHWHPDSPLRGSAYRCLRSSVRLDPLIAEAARAANLERVALRLLPCELTVWVDPDDVSYRIGEDGSICSLDLFEHSDEESSGISSEESDYDAWMSSPCQSPTWQRLRTSPTAVLQRSRKFSPATYTSRFVHGPASFSKGRPRPVITSVYNARLVSSVAS